MGTTIVWFRRDLRLTDNPVLTAAAKRGRVIPVFIHAPDEEGEWAPGGAQRWWLHHSLKALAGDLESRGSRLILRRGSSRAVLESLIRETGADAVFWNRRYEPAVRERDRAVAQALSGSGIEIGHSKAALLWEPGEIETGSGTPYRVFTPFWKACLRATQPGPPLPPPETLESPAQWPGSDKLDAWSLRPKIPWDGGLAATWEPGEAGAHARLERFLEGPLGDYDTGRDLPAEEGVSRISPHLHFGEISARSIWAEVAACRGDPVLARGAESYLRELGWREFAHHVLYHYPETVTRPMNPRFTDFPWREDGAGDLAAWCKGRTGIPIVDAAMRQLYETGWMHNRARMIVASLLVKNLNVHWLEGARWFWDTLVDADLASNTMGWQWSAGCGADAAPYFRIFNPVRQGERFDPDGAYVKRYVPELNDLPPKLIHQPWKLSERDRRSFGFTPGETYPGPIVDLSDSRTAALAMYKSLREG